MHKPMLQMNSETHARLGCETHIALHEVERFNGAESEEKPMNFSLY